MCSRVHSGSRGFTQGHLGVVVFIHRGMCSLRRAKWSSGSFGFACVHYSFIKVRSGAPTGSCVHLVSRGFILSCLGVVLFILVRVGTFGRA